MSKVSADMSMSLDGFITGPNDNPAQGLGEGGERLHEWLVDLASFHTIHNQTGGVQNKDSEVLAESMQTKGAVILGRRMFDLAEAAWGENPPFHVPVFVVTHRAHEKLVKEGGTTFYFVTDGIESALRQAQDAAGAKDVAVGGGASIIQQYIVAGLLDELQLHIVPLLLGGGRRMFDQNGLDQVILETTRVIESPKVTHLRFRVVKKDVPPSQ